MAPSGCKVAIWMFGWAENRFCFSHTKSANEMTRNVWKLALHNIYGFFLVGKWWKQWHCGDSGSCSAIGHVQEATQWPCMIQLNSTINQSTAFYCADHFLWCFSRKETGLTFIWPDCFWTKHFQVHFWINTMLGLEMTKKIKIKYGNNKQCWYEPPLYLYLHFTDVDLLSLLSHKKSSD